MLVATWNVNSIRARLERVGPWLDKAAPDVLCLQETKVIDEDFPREVFEERGYTLFLHGQPTYNGVALAVKAPLTLEDPVAGIRGAEDHPLSEEARVVSGTVAGVRVIGAYVINGKEVGTPHFERKLTWLELFHAHVREELALGLPTLVTGDFNIAPQDRDIWDAERFAGQVLCTEAERERYLKLLGLGLVDGFREFHDEEDVYSWWDYRALAFQKRRGWRIDLILANASARERLKDVRIDKDERRGKKPSDHAPVLAELTLPA